MPIAKIVKTGVKHLIGRGMKKPTRRKSLPTGQKLLDSKLKTFKLEKNKVKIKNIDDRLKNLKVEKVKAQRSYGKKYKTITERNRNIKNAKKNINDIEHNLKRLKIQRKNLLRKK
tara:strand:+ start:393 stop:737 length:345 start_codon:yes stop_codon:yes gene_type:complete